jgi:hypothetical protein
MGKKSRAKRSRVTKPSLRGKLPAVPAAMIPTVRDLTAAALFARLTARGMARGAKTEDMCDRCLGALDHSAEVLSWWAAHLGVGESSLQGLLPLPEVPEGLREPLRDLTRAGLGLLAVVDELDKGSMRSRLRVRGRSALDMANGVLRIWMEHLGVTEEDLLFHVCGVE